MKPPLLIIFYRNPELGKVKSRLAATLGEEKALAIYLKLAAHTREVSSVLKCDKVVYYSRYIDTEDNWDNSFFFKRVQHGEGLGAKMTAAFEESFLAGYHEVCIIGTDCLELTSHIIKEAFEKLKANDVVIGPARDGGYYLLGMKKLHPQFFQNKEWSTSTVFNDTMTDVKNLHLSSYVLPIISDVDKEKDLPPSFNLI